MPANIELGRYGERLAVRHLTDAGLEIVARNWRCSDGELDIVARDGPVLVFCEVKTRTGIGYGDPLEAVTPAKAARLRRLALAWLAQQRSTGDPAFWPELRFDVVSVVRPRAGATEVRHVRAVI